MLLSIIFFGCVQQKNTPEDTLAVFIQKRFQGKSIDDLKSFLSGNFFKNFEDSSDDLKEQSLWVIKDQSLKKFKVIDKACDEQKCKITYFVSYFTNKDNKREFMTETKKMAELIKENKKWVIESITHLKTYHDSLQNL
jgi:hypothetical protein